MSKKLPFYCSDSKEKRFTSRDGDIFTIEIIDKPRIKLKENMKGIFINDVCKLAKVAWGDPGVFIDKVFSLADIWLVAWKGDELKGWTAARIRNNVANFLSTTISPEVQQKGLASFLIRSVIKIGWWRNRGWKLWEWFSPFYLATRTCNPCVYESLSQKMPIFPSLKNRVPSKQELKIAIEVAHTFSPDNQFNPELFVIQGALVSCPDLIYRVDDIPWSSNSSVNQFLEERLELTKRKGNMLVIVGRVLCPLSVIFRR